MARRTCDCGECAKCKHREYMNAWYRRPERAERVRAWAKRYRADKQDLRPRRKRDPQKDRAARIVNRAILRGELAVGPCEGCGAENLQGRDGRRLIQAHHEDYSRPLEVRWLCSACHGIEHRVIV